MSNYFNDAGEPLMDGAAMRYEMYLDSTYEPEPDYYLTHDVYREDYEVDPEDCDHPDTSNTDHWTQRCDVCYAESLILVRFSWDHMDAPNEVVVWNV